MKLRFLERWRADKALRRHASAYVTAMYTEPSETDVQWLTSAGTHGDLDHARWELRYARLAVALLTAERDALDDRTAAMVVRELTPTLAASVHVDPSKLDMAERQLNARIAAYREALQRRRANDPTALRLGRTLLLYAGTVSPSADEAARAGEILAQYMSEANEQLRREFGTASLPEDVAPSQLERTPAP